MSDATGGGELESALTFPSEFPIKMMGRDRPEFHAAARAIVERHAGPVDDDQVRQSLSRKENFVSVTITITAESQAQLDSIYEDLSAHDEILVAL